MSEVNPPNSGGELPPEERCPNQLTDQKLLEVWEMICTAPLERNRWLSL